MSKKKRKVTLISRESDNISLDFRMLEEELLRRGIEVEVLSKLFTKNISIQSLSYVGHIAKQIKAINESTVVILDTYCIPASMLPHTKDTTIIQMWHALSAVKKFGWQTVGKEDGSSKTLAKIMKMHDNYDQVLCCSDVTASYFCEAFRVSPRQIVKLGLPRIDYILKEDKEIVEKIRNQYMRIGNSETILYAPTFHKGSVPDVRGLAECIDFEKYNLLVKLHPLDRGRVEHVGIPGVIYEPYYDTYDLLKAADYVISDYSSFVVEASLTNKPLYLYTYDVEDYSRTTGLNMDFKKESIGKYAFSNAEELMKNLTEEPYDYEALEVFRKKYIDIDVNDCTKKLADYIESLL